MRKKNKNQLPIIPIGLSVCFLGIITFLFLHFATQNEAGRMGPTPPVSASPNPDEDPDNNGADGPPDTINVIYRIENTDIRLGSLVLVDKDNKYELKESDLPLVLVRDAKTVPFQMRPDYVTKLSQTVIEPLDELMQAYINEVGENTVYIYIGYRDEAAQQKTLDDFTAMLGRSAALKRVALPGHSEHHTGLAMDFGALVDGVHHTFDYRESNHHAPTKWFAENSYRFGFILSFPEDRAKDGETIYEPWHYRYVGYPHSHIMFDNNWSLKEYLTEIAGYSQERPFKADYNGDLYEIFFYSGYEITFTFDNPTGDYLHEDDIIDIYKEFFDSISVSGNNIDGFIVTIRK